MRILGHLATFFLPLILASLTPEAPPHTTFASYDYGVPKHTVTKKRQTSGIYVTNGVHTGRGQNGELPLRYEIRELQKDVVTWTLYMLGLDMLQYTDQTEMLSWYQLSSIHGRPFVPFNNIHATPGNQNNGYCMHVSILFPTWHRPYLALYEQVMYGLIQDISNMYPKGAMRDMEYKRSFQHVTASATFRIPYWDWAAPRAGNESVLPRSIGGSSLIQVDGPAGIQTIVNPLYSYRFQPLNSSELTDPPFDEFWQTFRSPTTNDSSAHSRNNVIAERLYSNALSIRSRIYTLLTIYHDYEHFSNERYIASASSAAQDPLESVHDQIHGLTGNGGHMSYIDYAAFDPIFWLHHVMLDRCFAMWQVLNPKSYVIPYPAKYSTFTSTAGDIQHIHTPLTPFYKDTSGNFWTSSDVVETDTFGYLYPETVNVPGTNVTSNVITAINALYGPGSGSSTTRRGLFERGGTYREWIANIRVRKHASNGPFFIYIFLGTLDPDPRSWADDPNLAGSHTFFAKTGVEDFGDDINHMVTATIPLTHALVNHIERGDLESLELKDVNPYLAANLGYRVALLNDTKVDNLDVPNLKISIVSAEVTMPAGNSQLPVWGEMQGQMDVSSG